MISNQGLINPTALITSNKWGVTVTVDPYKNHARLIFEGIENDNYFYLVAHLNGTCNIDSGCYLGYSRKATVNLSEPLPRERFRALFAKKSPTWLASKEKINNLILDIKREQGQEVPFNICGDKSIASQPTEVYYIYNEVLGAIKNQDASLFIALCDSAQNDGKCTGMSAENFDLAIINTLRAINPDLQASNLRYSDLIQLINTSIERHSQYQDNCFTWTLRKLKKIGVETPVGILGKIASFTRLYIRHNPNDEVQPIECNTGNGLNYHVQTFPREAFSAKYVTYNTTRDIRTEEWKVLEKKLLINETQRVSAEMATIAGLAALGLGALTLAVPIALGGIGCAILGLAADSQLLEKRHDLVDEKVGMNQPGNKNWDSIIKNQKLALFELLKK